VNLSVNLNHIGLYNSSLSHSEKFYRQLLGLENIYQFQISKDLAKNIFGLENDYQVVIYGNSQLRMEIFIGEGQKQITPTINHICLNVENMVNFLEKCREMEVEINTVKRNDREIFFIKDYDGNLFEIKEK
jgi:catechol 2,3-dioxygenase-like lactoylglutathione lyase family enzyme